MRKLRLKKFNYIKQNKKNVVSSYGGIHKVKENLKSLFYKAKLDNFVIFASSNSEDPKERK